MDLMTVRDNRGVLIAAVFSGLLILPGTALGQIDCDTIPAPSPLPFDSVAVYQYAGGNDCWGWIAPDGTEYAIMGARTGVAFINIVTGQEDGFVTGATCTWRDMKTYRNYCYAVSECGGDGVMVIDMSYLPDSVHLVQKFTSGGNRSHNLTIDTARGFAYACRQNYSGFRILDLAVPEAPVEVGWVNTGDIHDMYARNDTVWVAEANNHKFSIWDLGDKLNPVSIATVTIPGTGYVHNIWPTLDGRYVVTTEETAFKTVKIWKTVDLGNISMVSEYLAPAKLAHNAHVEGNYLFLSHYESGLAVLDITYPECPVEVVLFDTYTTSENSNFNGCWGIYPHAGTGHVYASNLDGRLFVFETNIVSADFQGTPLIGDAPLSVEFTEYVPGTVLSRTWDFGDGNFSSALNPTHLFEAGIYTVQLSVTTAAGSATPIKTNYVTAIAETLHVTDGSVTPGDEIYWEISMTNHVPVEEIILPISLTNVTAFATLDSISRVGTRIDYFQLQQILFENAFAGQQAVLFRADGGGGGGKAGVSPLAPGTGPIARVHLTVKIGATPGETIDISMAPVNGHALSATTATTDFTPVGASASLTILTPPCTCLCHGDPQCDGQTDILDVVYGVNVAFREAAPFVDPLCWPAGRTDVDCSGETDILDVVRLVEVAFREADPALSFCDPCAP